MIAPGTYRLEGDAALVGDGRFEAVRVAVTLTARAGAAASSSSAAAVAAVASTRRVACGRSMARLRARMRGD